MNYCKYHPLAPATFMCLHCNCATCDHCSDEGQHGDSMSCFLCGRELESLGASNQAEPFWRRFDKSFRYPFSAQSAALIVVVSLLMSVVLFLPLAWLWYLMLSGLLLKYSFSCLASTAHGSMVPPDISTAYGGGLSLIGGLLIILAAVVAAIVATFQLLGLTMAMLIACLAIAGLPASIIIYAMTDSTLKAINPLRIFHLISAVGLPYGLLLVIIMIMTGSVEALSGLIGSENAVVTPALQSMISNYYTIVLFHIMGYMLFQYQAELGFTARDDAGEGIKLRKDPEWALAKIQVLIKDGQYAAAASMFDKAVSQFPNNHPLNTHQFEFLMATHNRHDPESVARTARCASQYLRFLAQNHRTQELGPSYRRVVKTMPEYKPDSAELRLLVARHCRDSGDSRSAVRLLNGMHREHPGFEGLIAAYQLMANALDDLPDMRDQAAKCRKFIRKLEQHAARPAAAHPSVV